MLTPPTCVSFSTVAHESTNRGFSWEAFKPLLLKKEFVTEFGPYAVDFPAAILPQQPGTISRP